MTFALILNLFQDGCDLAFMVDVSSSITSQDLNLALNLISKVFHSFTLGNGVRYGLLVFGESAKVRSRLLVSLQRSYSSY